MKKNIALIFLGDFFFDARCINLADTIIDAGVNLNIIDAGKTEDKYRKKSIIFLYLRRVYSNIYDFIEKQKGFWQI